MTHILAITAYTGGEELVAMTERMLTRLRSCDPRWNGGDATMRIVAVNNAAKRQVEASKADVHITNEKNEGFGKAINKAIAQCMTEATDYVLVLNNDLEFPHPDWICELMKERDNARTVSPCTDKTATTAAVAIGPKDNPPKLATQVSAFCWLVPAQVVRLIRKQYGFQLFHPEFTNYGSDDVTGAILRKLIGRMPFKVVPRSWVRHLKAQTSKVTGDKAGDPKVLKRIREYFRSQGLR